MRTNNGFIAVIIAMPFLSACATDKVIFVTKTAIAVDGDTASPPSFSVGYDRVEAYLAPRYPDGAVPPVVASLQADLGIFTPQVSQLYATGAAALNVAGANATQPETCSPATLTLDTSDKTQNKQMMIFTTATTLGLKLGFSSSGAPSSITFGYKRKEASVIPVGVATGSDKKETDGYPSVLASINVNVQSDSQTKSAVALSDFIATGAAADCLALSSSIRNNFSSAADAGTKPAKAGPSSAAGPKPQLVR